jgi:glycosyltransferase involved in cell wall biosynthesis
MTINNSKKICLIYNFPQHYRLSIFTLLDAHLNIHFIFGNKMDNVKKFDTNLLSNTILSNNIYIFNNIYYQTKVISSLFKNFDTLIILADYRNISYWILIFLNKLFFKKKVIFWTHGYYGNESFLKHIFKKFFFSFSDYILLYGNYAKHLMLNKGYDSNKLFVIYNSHNFEKIKQVIRNSIYKYSLSYNIIFIGRLTKSKKIQLLLDAIYKIKYEYKDIKLFIIGDGSEKQNLINKVSNLELNNNVYFLGEILEESEIYKYFVNSSICVSPGNVGLTAIHSMSYGIPVITHNNFKNQMPEFEIIKNGYNGYFFEENNLLSLVDVLIFHFKNQHKINNENCFDFINKYYNPIFQFKIITDVINK